MEYILFGDSLKPKMVNVLTIRKKLEPVIADSDVPDALLRNFNNGLTPMQKNLNETIRHLDFLIGEIIKFSKSDVNLESSVGVISENPVFNIIEDFFIDFINSLNPVSSYIPKRLGMN